jgi:hypothetical protein
MAARKLLIASIGIAASTLACSDDNRTIGNAMDIAYDTGPYDSTFLLDAADAKGSSVDASDTDAPSDSSTIDVSKDDAEAGADAEDASDAD